MKRWSDSKLELVHAPSTLAKLVLADHCERTFYPVGVRFRSLSSLQVVTIDFGNRDQYALFALKHEHVI